MPKPNDVGVGNALVISCGNRILLGKRKGAHFAGYWSFPGGWLDREDTSTSESVVREALEETGLVIPANAVRPVLWTTEDNPSHGFRTVTLFHHVEVPEELEAKLMEPNKCDGWAWFDRDALPSPLMPSLEEALKASYFNQDASEVASLQEEIARLKAREGVLVSFLKEAGSLAFRAGYFAWADKLQKFLQG